MSINAKPVENSRDARYLTSKRVGNERLGALQTLVSERLDDFQTPFMARHDDGNGVAHGAERRTKTVRRITSWTTGYDVDGVAL